MHSDQIQIITRRTRRRGYLELKDTSLFVKEEKNERCKRRCVMSIQFLEPIRDVSIDDLPFDILQYCLSFTGTGNFRYIGGVSRSFRHAYMKIHGNNSCTNVSSIVSSVPCVDLYLSEVSPTKETIDLIWKHSSNVGNLNVMKHLFKSGYPIESNRIIASNAICNGHIHVLQWLREISYPLGERECMMAAAAGNLKVLKWLKKNDCPWDANTCNFAARSHLKVLQYAIESGCPHDEWIILNAALSGRLEILQWIIQNGYSHNLDRQKTYEYAEIGGHMHVIKWLNEIGFKKLESRDHYDYILIDV